MCSLFPSIPGDAVISAITPLPDNPNMRRVRVGKKSVATLRAIDVESLGLEVGKTWTSQLADAAQREIESHKARLAAMKLLGRRAYSRQEVIERLTQKGHDRAIAQRIADELETDHWIDDAAYGQSIVREANRRQPASRRLLIAKLESRKLDRGLARNLAEQSLAGTDEMQAALQLARTRLATMHQLPAATVQRRLASLLARRGFDDKIIQDVLEHVQPNESRDSSRTD